MAQEAYNDIVGKRIREFRESMELVQTEFAQRVGTSQSTVSQWEKGERKIKVEDVYNICDAFRVSPSRILPASGGVRRSPAQIAHALEKLAAWARGEAVEWHPKDVDELQLVEATPQEPTPDEDEGTDP